MPKWLKTAIVNPEQSAPPVRLAPPYTYGLPTNCVAYDAIWAPSEEVCCASVSGAEVSAVVSGAEVSGADVSAVVSCAEVSAVVSCV